MTTMTLEQVRDALRNSRNYANLWSRKLADAIDAHLAKGAQVPDEMKSLYEAASKGFHTWESCGPDNKYWHVSKFQSLEELHAFSDAWARAMVLVRDKE